MEFNNNQPIFIQIANLICRRVLNGTYKPDNRIPSVRELGVETEVNPNTVMRSYERLQNEGVIYNKRGIGYFISSDAPENIQKQRYAAFMQEELPVIFREMQLLGINIDDLTNSYKDYLSNKLISDKDEEK